MRSDILLVGLPRSGTSWVGSVLGSSPSVTYEREPITQAWLEADNRSPLVDPSADGAYRDHAAGVLSDHGHRRLVKEVNPLLVPHVLAEFPVTVVLLRRHPCAVALSYFERGWKRLDIEERFGAKSAGDFWHDHGAYQALLLSEAAAAVAGEGLAVAYEDLTENPHRGFADLAAALDMSWEGVSRDYLDGTLRENDPEDPYALQRDAATTRDRWMSALTPTQQQAVVAGYSQHRGDSLPKPGLPKRGWLRR